jgi:FkbM family methyltransferase
MSLSTSYQRLKKIGFAPTTFLDVGAYHGDWTRFTQSIFPTASYTMIEANAHPQLKTVNAKLIQELVSSTEHDVEWWSNGSTGDSILRERTRHYNNILPITRRTTTLDALFPTQSFDFIKIDCQGAEIEILKGGKSLIDRASVILLECPFAGQYNEGCPSFCEYIQYMDLVGFTPFDISEIHSSGNIIIQIDILFIRKDSVFTKLIQDIISS